MTSTVTAAAGEFTQMTFSCKPGRYEFNQEQFRKIAHAQMDGSIILTGNFAPLMVTKAGHPGVLSGDTIVEVMDEAVTDEVMVPLARLELALCQGGRLYLKVHTRPLNFDITLSCEGENWFKLGVLVTIERQHADRIKVQTVFDQGLIPDWNRQNPNCQVVAGDWIIHVNGMDKSAQEMAKEISSCQEGDDMWLGLQTRPRIMDAAMHQAASYNPKAKTKTANPRNEADLPPVMRAKTADWEQMQEDLSQRPMFWKN
jgi:hypothetical protein